MAIKVEYINVSKDLKRVSSEVKAAQDLCQTMEADLASYPNATGKIYVMTSVSMFAQKRRDIDLLVFGFIDDLELKGDFLVKTDDATDIQTKAVTVNSFVINIEVKDHQTVRLEADGYHVYYPSTNTDENVTKQVNEAMHSLRNHLSNHLRINPFICDIIWFRGVSSPKLNKERRGIPDNALPAKFSFIDLIRTSLYCANVYYYRKAYHLNSFPNGEAEFDKIRKFFKEKRILKGLTKSKFELLSSPDEEVNKIIKGAGKQLSICTGRAGTGKTVVLLQVAFKLASEEYNNRCLLLTYNKALVSDIQRLIDYTSIPTKMDGRTISIKTTHSFFQTLMFETGIINHSLDPNSDNYLSAYEKGLNELYEYICKRCSAEDIETLKDIAEEHIDWDYILIDEGQDWSDTEKKVVFKIYGPKRIIVADGVDQFVLDNPKQDWTRRMKKEDLWKPKMLKLERRQKANLARFVNSYAKLAGINWEVTENKDIPGGTVEIYPKYKTDIHIKLKNNCQDNECEDYDILILVPPSMVVHDQDGSHFVKAAAYESAKISIYDGTNSNNRSTYPTKDECRLYQYHSCRGLEGWCVVCDSFDKLIEYQIEHTKLTGNELGFDKDEIIKRKAYLWSLMPLTRPIDTLVITLEDPNSEVGQILKELSEKLDSVEWYC